ncbi:QRFP-like peptide receptor isoform X1 [Cylas formicarius]|uniref:QRFP-like peptide receptor isoform X1 n=1 Tax=Cylas formicarius TaxID=197179 RepID=UPI002958A37D|nr:QRFP-like peptide receptor isoform X1 [Cylas formicarius]
MISSIVTIATTTLNISANPLEANTTTVNYFYTTSTQELQDGGGVGNLAYNSSFNISGNVSFSIPIFPNYIRTTSMVFCIIIMCLGVIGNVMVPIVIFKTKDMRNSTNIFLVNLSVADLMVLLVCTPTVLVEVNSKPETWVLGREMCKAVPFVELTVAHASVLTILAISFERYYAICKPLKAGYICTKARASLICLLAWFIAAIFTSPILGIAEFKHVEYFDGSKVPACHTLANTFWSALYFLSSIFLFFIVPFIVLLVLYCIIAKNLISNAAALLLNKHIDNYSMRARRQVILMLGTVVMSFFVCLIPFRVFTLWIIIVPEENVYRLGVERYYNILYFCRIMVYLNSAVNPILYNLMSSKFRTGFVICSETRRRLFRNRCTNGNYITDPGSSSRRSREGYKVCYRPRNCSVLIKTSTDSSSLDSFKDSPLKQQHCLTKDCINEERASESKRFSIESRVNLNIFTEKVIICPENQKNLRRYFEGSYMNDKEEQIGLKAGKVQDETFV